MILINFSISVAQIVDHGKVVDATAGNAWKYSTFSEKNDTEPATGSFTSFFLKVMLICKQASAKCNSINSDVFSHTVAFE